MTIAEFLKRIVDRRYVVLRNWDNLPTALHRAGGDLDILSSVDDFDFIVEMGGACEVDVDVCRIGGGYFPPSVESGLLEDRVFLHGAFWVPNRAAWWRALDHHSRHHTPDDRYRAELEASNRG